MAKKSTEGSGQATTGINRMSSGLLHTSDSNQGNAAGRFVDFFGEPGSPTGTLETTADNGSYPGRAPALSTRFMKTVNTK